MEVKAGGTLSFVVRRTATNGTPITGDADNMKSQVRNRQHTLVGTFSIAETATPGEYLFAIPSTVTKEWSVGKLFFDIKYIDDDIAVFTPTFEIIVIKGVTEDA